MLKSIEVENYLGERLVLDLANPQTSGLVVHNIEGVGPEESVIHVTEMASSDGAIFNSARRNSRNIVLTLRMFDGEGHNVEDNRLQTYRFFPIKKNVKLTFSTDNRYAEISGYVESNTPVIFAKEEWTKISIICPDPNFYSAGSSGLNLTNFSGQQGLFEFPFSNESLDVKLIEIGELLTRSENIIWYNGDEEIGVVIRVYVKGPVKNLSIYNVTTQEEIRIDTNRLQKMTGKTLVEGDELIISTVVGDKYVRLLRDGKYINVLNALDRSTDWFKLSYGENIIVYDAEEGILDLDFTIENRISYEGI